MSRSFAEILTNIDEFYMGKSPVHQTLIRLARRLADHRIDYAVIGGMALAAHGFVRPTEDVDLLLTPDGLERFRSELVGLGYRPAFSARKTFRDVESGVKIEIITEGEYAGDGEPKPVVFPNPAKVAVNESGISVIRLAPLIELKLASGLSAEHRQLRDLGDVQRLVEVLGLDEGLALDLDVSVRSEYLRLWKLAQRSRELARETDEGLSL